MRELRFANFVLLLLMLGLSCSVSAQDLPETAYDESEGQPCEIAPLISEAMPQADEPASQATRSPVYSQSAGASRAVALRIHATEAHRSTEALADLALLCTLRC